MKNLFAALSLAILPLAHAADEPAAPLETQMESLQLPADAAPEAHVADEKIYAVQSRLVPLRHRHEVSLLGGRTLIGESFLTSYTVGLAYHFNVTDRWSVDLSGSIYSNTLTDSGKRLIEAQNLYPDLRYLRSNVDLTATFRPFYGKIRFGAQSTVHFDQYVSLGASRLELNTETKPAIATDLGLSFWMKQGYSFRLGLRDYFYRYETTASAGSAWAQDLQAHLDFGYVFGG
ncbi:MAG: outer membrane beta-barrel domain-containing protein [Bdellovibrionales bacterium]|nr:outer membrane beta-barrel domain-containing protein [Bdellovibrionales bacterium]